MTTRKGPMLEILGALVPPPLNRSVTNLVCANVLNYISISSLCRHWGAKNHKFDRFSTLSFCLGSAQRCRDKVEHGCTSMNIPLSNDTKFVSVLQCVDGDKQKNTKKKTKKIKLFRPLAARDIWALPNLAWGPYLSCTSKTCLPPTHSFTAWGRLVHCTQICATCHPSGAKNLEIALE